MEKETKRRINRFHFWGIRLFALTMAVMSLLGLCLFLRPSYSELEFRDLAKFPAPTVKTFLNGEFFDDINTWYADTFPFRERFLALSNSMEEHYGSQSVEIHGDVAVADEIPDASADLGGLDDEDEPSGATESGNSSAQTVSGDSAVSGDASKETASDSVSSDEAKDDGAVDVPELDENAKVETLNAVLVIDDAGYEYYNFNEKQANKYIKTVNYAAEQLSGAAEVYDMIIPTSMDICVPDSVRKNINTSDMQSAISYMYGSMSSSVKTVDIFNTMRKANAAGEYVYFRTDHHWTALGAYRAYEDFTKAAGVTTASLEDDFTEHQYDNFLGSFYRDTNSSAMAANPDVVYAYEPKDTNTTKIWWPDDPASDYTIITDVSSWAQSSKYSSAFIGGDEPLEKITNPNLHNGKSILLVKESFGICFAPFLVESYETVYVADYRYFDKAYSGSMIDFVKDKGIDQVLFLNNISATRNENLMTLLSSFVKG